MEIMEMINERRLEMLKESQKMGEYKGKLTNELQMVNMKLVELEAELKVLDRWEVKLTPPQESAKC